MILAVIDVNGADEAAFLGGGVEEMTNHEGGGCFAVGAGDGDEFEFGGGIVVESRSEDGGDADWIGRDQDGDVRRDLSGGWRVGENGGGPPFEGIVYKGGAIGLRSSARHKERSGGDVTRIIDDCVNGGLEITLRAMNVGLMDELLEIHVVWRVLDLKEVY